MTNLRVEWEAANYSIHPNGSECFFSEKPHERLVNRLYYVNQRNRSNHRRADNVMWSLYDSFIHYALSRPKHMRSVLHSLLWAFDFFHSNGQPGVIVMPIGTKGTFGSESDFCFQPATVCAFCVFHKQPAACSVETAINILRLNWSH